MNFEINKILLGVVAAGVWANFGVMLMGERKVVSTAIVEKEAIISSKQLKMLLSDISSIESHLSSLRADVGHIEIRVDQMSSDSISTKESIDEIARGTCSNARLCK